MASREEVCMVVKRFCEPFLKEISTFIAKAAAAAPAVSLTHCSSVQPCPQCVCAGGGGTPS